ncbi:hypothetical protein [Verminephrobacter aporrectodeae]|uniref:hypothetical protein n=1 Tax=Verminephrobacter aporrectodeae TaxID=1110389 RepID=UPI002244B5E4|nr:hypothetical protein [Verminephrobacter aporrectodeae]
MTYAAPARPNRNWLVIGILAFLVQGGWTLWVNLPHGLGRSAISAAMQGLLSGVSASVMTLIMEWIYRTLSPSPLRPIASALGPILLMASVLYAVHRVIGTPEIAATMALPMIAIVAYAIVYTAKLSRRSRSATVPTTKKTP